LNAETDDRIGLELGEGRYTILAQIGVGSMGRVYLARDHHLETEVVVKFPVGDDPSNTGSDLLERFTRETRSLVRLSHPHIVKIIDVGAHQGPPFVVLQYLSGGTLKERVEYGPDGARSMPPQSLRSWLLDVARALDFIHAQGHIHRVIKPANILFDEHGNAFLGDFGIVKALSGEGGVRPDSSLTAPGFLPGTPSYVAPELVMGKPGDGRSDQYSLALTIHELLSGRNVMTGPTASATLVNQMNERPTPLSALIGGLGRRLSDALQKALAKDPNDRYPSCTAMAEQILAHVPAGTWAGGRTFQPVALCPLCHRAIEVNPDRSGQLLRCPRCRTLSCVEVSSSGVRLVRVESSWERDDLSEDQVAEEAASSSVFEVCDTQFPRTVVSTPTSPTHWVVSRPSRLRKKWLAAGGVALVLAVVTTWLLLRPEKQDDPGLRHVAARPVASSDVAALHPAPLDTVTINIAYGTEKRRWLEAALKDFEQTEAGRRTKINLIGLGSVEGANAVLNGPGHTPIHVWSPASSAYRSVFERDWYVRHGKSPILCAGDLALTPMVFVLWKHRHDEFVKKYGRVSFRTIGQAMQEPGGWGTIASKPEWGLFKFGHTDPAQSNSGLLTLVLMAYDYAGKQRSLTTADVTSPEFLHWLATFERGVSRHGGTLTHSTGTLMEEMVKRGPSQYDCLIVYESLVIDYMKAARQRWGELGELAVVYPVSNIWNEHPYYVLDVPWSGPPERRAAAEFLGFLMSDRIQRRALDHGFGQGTRLLASIFPKAL
jgi:serine/threonine-protein kinase